MSEKIPEQETMSEKIPEQKVLELLNAESEENKRKSEQSPDTRKLLQEWHEQEFAACNNDRAKLISFNIRVASLYVQAGYLAAAFDEFESTREFVFNELNITNSPELISALEYSIRVIDLHLDSIEKRMEIEEW